MRNDSTRNCKEYVAEIVPYPLRRFGSTTPHYVSHLLDAETCSVPSFA
jgi:hypothetical protein